jgi:hypothetical protein
MDQGVNIGLFRYKNMNSEWPENSRAVLSVTHTIEDS